MKVISLLQPWATLVVIGAKKIETRSFNTKFRGELLIHASKAFPMHTKELASTSPFYDVLIEAGYLKINGRSFSFNLPFGAIIGKVNLASTIPSEKVQEGFGVKVGGDAWRFTAQEFAFGDYSPNRFGWLLKDAVQFAQLIPAKGQLGFWNYEMPEHIHIPNKYGGHATFGSPPDKETLDAVNHLTEVAYKTRR
jgi:activating signal cointegrator 1